MLQPSVLVLLYMHMMHVFGVRSACLDANARVSVRLGDVLRPLRMWIRDVKDA